MNATDFKTEIKDTSKKNREVLTQLLEMVIDLILT
jgi:hypothetical protein